MRGGWTPTQDPNLSVLPSHPAAIPPDSAAATTVPPAHSTGAEWTDPQRSTPTRPIAEANDHPWGADTETGLVDRLRGGRWALAPKHLGVIAIVLVLGLLWAGWTVLKSRPEPISVDRVPVGVTSGSPVGGSPHDGASNPPTPDTNGTRPPSPSPSADPARVVVHVAGKVRRPGLIRATTGARVADVLAAAGGALPGVDLTTVNLARQVQDGEQILIGVAGAEQSDGRPDPKPSTGGDKSSPAAGQPLDLNSATSAQLEALPGVGPVLALRIVEWRTQNGRFTAVEELLEISGVGAKKFEALRPHVRV
ncbi:helix-hairpin-helix domain-containing protein [Kribbella deserti]|uniref:Helix-hairpin-helix domain-containing protein n=1 Tax=Kribbella deserti TaxID=1926257 RepID=A0ABV6QDF0_9ACTN